jgi:glycine cleavage system aminomethyltransferase T
MGEFDVQGPAARDFLQRLLTNNLDIGRRHRRSARVPAC